MIHSIHKNQVLVLHSRAGVLTVFEHSYSDYYGGGVVVLRVQHSVPSGVAYFESSSTMEYQDIPMPVVRLVTRFKRDTHSFEFSTTRE